MAAGNPLVSPVHGHPLTEIPALAAAQAILGHRFTRPELLVEALTHRSAALDRWAGKTVFSASNERMEFIGDRVLGLLIAEWIAERHPAESEGDLGRRLALLVSQPVLAEIANDLGLAACLALSPSEHKAGVRKLATVLADAMEAVIGAVYLDAGLETARRFVRKAFAHAIARHAQPPRDAKTSLQEWAMQRGHKLPAYLVLSTTGPSHAPVFEIEVQVAGQTARATGPSKRQAEQDAARALLEILAS